MAYNNQVKLTGNLGRTPKIIETKDNKFAVISLATTDSYKEKVSGYWKNKETVWHEVIVFNPSLIKKVSEFAKGTRISIEGYLSYRPIEIVDETGKKIKKNEASIVAFKINESPLEKKANAERSR